MIQFIIITILKIVGILIIILFVIFLLGEIYQILIENPREEKRGWRTRPLGRAPFLYQQKGDNEWKEIVISSELLSGKISRVIYFETEKNWTDYPSWAQNREEIIKRIKQDYPPKRTEYKNT